MTPRVRAVSTERRLVPLTRPYPLSFTELTTFDAVLVHIAWDDGTTTQGEVVPLPGYSTDTVASTLEEIEHVSPMLTGLTGVTAADLVSARSPSCARSAVLLALCIATVRPTPFRIPVVAATAATTDLEQASARAAARGFTTLKVKLTGDADMDINAIRSLRSPATDLRFDANQAYGLADALRVADALASRPRVELFEQPLPAERWDELAKLARTTEVPIMLDESIRELDDVARASDMGARFVKLKLYKQGSLTHVLHAARQAHSLGMRVVFGNGVATDIVNWAELSLWQANPDLFHGASESVGFAKTQVRLRYPGLTLEDGHAVFQRPAGTPGG